MEAERSKIKAPAWSGSGEVSLADLQAAVCLLCLHVVYHIGCGERETVGGKEREEEREGGRGGEVGILEWHSSVRSTNFIFFCHTVTYLHFLNEKTGLEN